MRTVILAGLLALGSCRSSAPAEPSRALQPEGARDNVPGQRPAAPQGPAVVLHPSGGRAPLTVSVEVARTPSVRERGLMYRREMAEDHGMIFVFKNPDHQVFWMHNTFIPLDMVFIRADRTVLGIVENATPETDSPREVSGDSMYVLELSGGYARRHGLAAGDRVELVAIAPAVE